MIKNPVNEYIVFYPNASQERLMKIFDRKFKCTIVSKKRNLGGSTCLLFYAFELLQKVPNMRILIVHPTRAQSYESIRRMWGTDTFDKMMFQYGERALQEFSNGSSLSITHARSRFISNCKNFQNWDLIILDEMEHMHEPFRFFECKRIIALCTPSGKFGDFGSLTMRVMKECSGMKDILLETVENFQVFGVF